MDPMDTPIDPKTSIWISLTTPGLEAPDDRKLSINDSGTMLRADAVAPPLLVLQTRKPTCGFTGATSAILGQFLETEVASRTKLSVCENHASPFHHVLSSIVHCKPDSPSGRLN
ncbi:prenyltransferase, UbiA family [Trichinella spiralis]|uniref:prenyltransferase, UbiA family n=1 Tax=Trichinella spiralis TaxID=6334 RepID=UPI0001EFC339|nr:prenyltransferase, UbiA family [Trichinella spiralis]